MVVNSRESYVGFIERFKEDCKKYKFVRVQWKNGDPRTLPQNDMFYELYNHIAEQLYGNDRELARAEFKLDVGLPILAHDDDDFRDMQLAFEQFPREKQLRMILAVDITSAMDKDQARRAIDNGLDHYAMAGVIWPEYLLKVKK